MISPTDGYGRFFPINIFRTALHRQKRRILRQDCQNRDGAFIGDTSGNWDIWTFKIGLYGIYYNDGINGHHDINDHRLDRTYQNWDKQLYSTIYRHVLIGEKWKTRESCKNSKASAPLLRSHDSFQTSLSPEENKSLVSLNVFTETRPSTTGQSTKSATCTFRGGIYIETRSKRSAALSQ